MNSKPARWIRVAIIQCVLLINGYAMAQASSTPANEGNVNNKMTGSAGSKHQQLLHDVRASALIGKDVRGKQGKKVGEIKDLIVYVQSGDVRYALLDFDPGLFKSDKIFAVPLTSLSFVADGKTLSYRDISRAALMKAGVEKRDWQKAVTSREYVQGLDSDYGFAPPAGTPRSFRASELIGKSVNSASDKDIGEIKELVVDMDTAKIRYAVLAFDPSWMTKEKLYAFPLTAFKMSDGKSDLVLNVNKSTIQPMKNFDANRWLHLNDLDQDAQVNKVPVQ